MLLNLLYVMKLVLSQHHLWMEHLGGVTYIADSFTCDHGRPIEVNCGGALDHSCLFTTLVEIL